MSGDQLTGVLDLKAPLEQGLEQVPDLPGDAQQSRSSKGMQPTQLGKKADLGNNATEQAADDSTEGSLAAFLRADRGVKRCLPYS